MTQNYDTATKQTMPSLKIQTTVQVYDTVELDIKLPYFCKTHDAMFKVVSQEKAVRIANLSPVVFAMICNPGLGHIAKEIASATAISEIEFELALEKALSTIKTVAA